MNSFYWTQGLLVIGGTVLALFISFGPNRTSITWLKYLGIVAAVALFIANQIVMTNTGDGLDRVLNCWIAPTGVGCSKSPELQALPELVEATAAVPKLPPEDLFSRGLTAYDNQDFENARAFYKEACEGEVYLGCTNLGFMLEQGKGGDTDEQLARTLYEKACDSGEVVSCYNLERIGRK